MSKILATVTYTYDSRGIGFVKYHSKLRVRAIAEHFINIDRTQPLRAEFVCLRGRKMLPSFFGLETSLGILSWAYHGILQWTYLEGLEKYIMDADYIFTVETYSFLSRQCANIANRFKKSLVISVFETIPNIIYHKLPPYIQNTKVVVEKTDLFRAYTNRAKSYLMSLSVPEEKIKVIYDGLNLNKFYPRKEPFQRFVPRILFVGNLIPQKGVKKLLEAFSLLCKNDVKAELWICGGGKLEPMVREYARKYPIKHLCFVEHDKIPDVYRQCDIFCLPSHDLSIFGVKVWEEQFGMALVEAMASGLPIVTTNSGAIPEVVGSENVVVPQGSVKELYLALGDLIEDVKKRRQIGVSNRKRALELFDARKNCERLEKEILSLDSK
ncbi:MAG: glycosyltransferase family 4 protein [Candidatus Thermoplasmatota archaeon]|nr:glycosyltransferase family 4 protein [Candidatus Thermoplasmatota archaeon]